MSNETNTSKPKTMLIAMTNANHSKELADSMKEDHKIELPTIVANGEAAWNAIKDGNFDYIVIDWKLQKLPSLTLFNRIRQEIRFQNVPVLVVSDLTQKENFVVLKDYPLTGIADGGFSAKVASLKFGLLLKECEWYTTHRKALDEIAGSMKVDQEGSRSRLAELIKSAPKPVPILNIAAKKYRELGYFSEAENLLKEALKKDSQNLTSTMEMAKVLHFQGKHKDSLALMKTQKFSMKNVERLLFLGEVNLAEKNADEALDIFKNALKIDEQNAVAKAGVLASENMRSFLASNTEEALPQNLASMLNLVAITLVKSGKEQEGMDQYKAALSFVHDSFSQARVMYNIALGYVRWSKKKEALDWFKKSVATGGDQFAKANEHIKKISEELGLKPGTNVASSISTAPTKKSA